MSFNSCEELRKPVNAQEQIIADQVQKHQQALLRIPHEDWNQVCILDEQHGDVEVEIIAA